MPTYYSVTFSWKLPENEDNWAEAGAPPKFVYVDLPQEYILSLEDSRVSILQSYRKSKTHLPRLVRVNNSKQIGK